MNTAVMLRAFTKSIIKILIFQEIYAMFYLKVFLIRKA